MSRFRDISQASSGRYERHSKTRDDSHGKRRRPARHLLSLESYDHGDSYRQRNDQYRNENRQYHSAQPARAEFQEIEGGAFFIGKLNKFHGRDQIYSALRQLADEHDFYVRKLDMPYGCNHTKKGNKGFCFVHCKSKEQADRMIAMRDLYLGDQLVEIKPYSGRGQGSMTNSGRSSGYQTPPQNAPVTRYTQNPLNIHEPINIMPDAAPLPDRVRSEHSSGNKSLRSSEISDCESAHGEILKPDVERASEDSQYSMSQSPSATPVPEPTQQSYDWDQIYSLENVAKYVQTQESLAQSRGISSAQFYQNYVDIYQKLLPELEASYQASAESVTAVAETWAPALLQSCP
jgi:hypothetical protein